MLRIEVEIEADDITIKKILDSLTCQYMQENEIQYFCIALRNLEDIRK